MGEGYTLDLRSHSVQNHKHLVKMQSKNSYHTSSQNVQVYIKMFLQLTASMCLGDLQSELTLS